MKTKGLLLLILLLPLLCGCNDTDDVQKIFTGKTWKLNYITAKNEHKMFNFWGNDAVAREKSIKYLAEESGSYQIKFEGITKDNIISGSVSGRAAATSFNGTWKANAQNKDFQAIIAGGKETDLLAKNFYELLGKVNSYSGDEHNLYLNFENLSMVFFVVPNK